MVIAAPVVLMLICQRGMYLEQCDMRAYDSVEQCEKARWDVRAYLVRCLQLSARIEIPREQVK